MIPGLHEGLIDKVLLLAWLLGPVSLLQCWTGMGNNPGKWVGSCPGGNVSVGIRPTRPCMKCWPVVNIIEYSALDGTCPWDSCSVPMPVLCPTIYIPCHGHSYCPALAFVTP